MKRVTTTCLATALSCAVAAGAHAQQPGQTSPSGQGNVSQPRTQQPSTPTSGQTGQRTTPSQAQTSATASSFIGCLERGSTPNSFALNVTEMPSGAATSGQASTGKTGNRTTAQATGTAGTSTVMVGKRVQLVGGNNLAAHAGHKVEITGMVMPQAQGTGTARQGQAAADMRVNVSNLRMIDSTCTPASTTRGTTGTSEPIPAPERQTPRPEQQGDPEQRQY